MPEVQVRTVTHQQASQLFHNKFVVVLGDSIQRAVYKDLVLLLKRDSYLSLSQLKTKGELSFEEDNLVEGGKRGLMTNGTEYREVRQYRTDHHLVRFYFITRIFSRYMQGILADFKNGLKPDLIIVNSCVWDVSRYNRNWLSDYRENLNKFFGQLKTILPEESLMVWNMTMPLGQRITGGFLVPEIQDIGPALRYDVIEANFYGAMLADAYGLDVLDLHFLFRFSLQHRMKDGVHWNAVVHRQITFLLLAHAAQAWGVELPKSTVSDHSKLLLNKSKAQKPKKCRPTSSRKNSDHYTGSHNPTDNNFYMDPNSFRHSAPSWLPPPPPPYNGFRSTFYEDCIPPFPQFCSGYFNFEESQPYITGPPNYHQSNGFFVPGPPPFAGNNYVMRHKHTKRQYSPYSRKRPSHHYRY